MSAYDKTVFVLRTDLNTSYRSGRRGGVYPQTVVKIVHVCISRYMKVITVPLSSYFKIHRFCEFIIRKEMCCYVAVFCVFFRLRKKNLFTMRKNKKPRACPIFPIYIWYTLHYFSLHLLKKNYLCTTSFWQTGPGADIIAGPAFSFTLLGLDVVEACVASRRHPLFIATFLSSPSLDSIGMPRVRHVFGDRR